MDGDGSTYTYVIKVTDAVRKGQYKVHKLHGSPRTFTSTTELVSTLKEKLNEHVPDSESFDIGYIEPSRQGIRGKTRWIFDHQDIDDMYKAYESAKKKEIILWCEGRKKESSDSKRASKRPSSEQQSSSETQKKARTSCNEKNAKTLDEVDVIYKKTFRKTHRKVSC